MRTESVSEYLGPFHNRPDEWELYQPLVGKTMLELGCKINSPFTYKDFFESLGYRHVSVDWNGKFGSLALDLRHPISLGTFDVVSNIGTSEHVEGQPGVWQNMADASAIGTVLLSATPKPGDWTWHGFWYPERQFYTDFADLNGFEIERLYEVGEPPRRMYFCRMVRQTLCPFQMPKGNMYRTGL